MTFLFGMFTGFFIASLISFICFCFMAGGTLKIDHSDPEKDLYRFEIDDLDDLSKKKRVILSIEHDANLSQK